MAKKTNKNILKLSINFEGFKLEVESDNPDKTLSKLNTLINSKKALLEAMLAPSDSLDMYDYVEEDNLGFDINSRKFSKELLQNKEYVELIRNLYLKHKNFLYRKEMIDAKQEIDLTNRKLNLIIDKNDLNTLTRRLVFNVSNSKIKHVFVHVMSDNFTKDHENMLLDEIKKRSGFADATLVFTPKKLNGVVVAETLFFGDFPQQNEEE